MGSSVFLTGPQSWKEGRIPWILLKDLAISLCKTCSVSLREIWPLAFMMSQETHSYSWTSHWFFTGLSFLRCKATAIMPNSQGFYKDEIRSWIKQPEPTRCRLRTEHQAFPPAKRLTSPPATLRPKIKVMLREVINYSCHLWIVEATNAEIHRSQE